MMRWQSIAKEVIRELSGLLYWTMLAACTVGPGTVVTCARAGAEFQLNLMWALIVGSLIAYVLQEGTARLTIVSGKSLGQCLQWKYRNGYQVWRVGVICWLVAASVFFGNILYECNNWAGGMAAIYSLPGVKNTASIRIPCCIAYAVIVLTLLFTDKVNALGVGLGLIMVGMVVLFFVVVVRLGLDGKRFGLGLLPISMPSGSTNIVLSLVGTTSIGFNLFLGGAMAQGKTLSDARKGIAFSTLMAFIVSVLIMIVGDGTYRSSQGEFTIASLADLITQLTGTVGVWIYSIGFIAAAISSMLTVPLGAALTAESVFSIHEENINQATFHSANALSSLSSDASVLSDSKVEVIPLTKSEYQPFKRKYQRMLMVVMVAIATLVISADAPTVMVILIAQVFNGCLLPFFSICLLISLNDEEIMKERQQTIFQNIALVLVVMVTIFLTGNTLIQNLLGWLVTNQHMALAAFESFKLITSLVVSLILICSVIFVNNVFVNFKRLPCISQ